MQTATTLFSFHVFLELLAMASLCGWGACLAFGMSLFSPSKALLIGSSGIVTGFGIWAVLGLPAGPWVSDFPLLPSVVGTLIVAFGVELVTEILESPFRITGPGAEEAAARRGGVGAGSEVAAAVPQAEREPRPAEPDDAATPASSPEAR
jgi:hypothetical protein